MIREDLENVDYKELSELERQEYHAILTLNARKLVLQLMNAGRMALSALISLGISIDAMAPAKMNDLLLYTSKLAEIIHVEQETARRNQELAAQLTQPQATQSADNEPQGEFPDLESENEN